VSAENVKIVERVVAAVNDRDVRGYLAHCTDDVQLRTPAFGAAAFGVYDGPVGITRFFADVEDAAPDFHVTIERLEPVGADRVLAFMHLAASGRTTGIETPMDSANVYEFVEGKIARTRVFLDRAEALKAVGLEP
jgi:hypothetical protein